MNVYLRRLLLILGLGLMFVFVAQLISRNFYLAASVEFSAESGIRDSLMRTEQALNSRIAVLESPSRLRSVGTALGLAPLPLESFVLMESGVGR